MAPKKTRPQKIDGPPPLHNRDHLERANYALQASLLLRQLGANRAPADAASEPRSVTAHRSASASSDQAHDNATIGNSAKSNLHCGTTVRQRKRGTKGGREALGELSRTEVTSLRKWTVHNQVKLDPAVKRLLCPCGTVLVAGMTARVRVKSSKQHKHRLVTSCLQCGHSSSVSMAKASWSNRERPTATPAAEAELPKQQKNSADTVKVEGHVIWAGGERVDGWGETVQS